MRFTKNISVLILTLFLISCSNKGISDLNKKIETKEAKIVELKEINVKLTQDLNTEKTIVKREKQKLVMLNEKYEDCLKKNK